MHETRVLLVFPGSLYGGRWADGPRVKPELVQLFTELRRAGFDTDVLDLEAELGNPADDVGARELPADRRRPAGRARGGPGGRLVLVRPPVLGRRRRRRAGAAAAAGRRDRRLRPPRLGAPGRLQRPGRALRLAHRRRGGDGRRDARRAGRGRRARDRRVPLAGGHAAAAGLRAPARLRGVSVHGRGVAGARPLPQPRVPVQRAVLPVAPGRRRLARLPAGRRRRRRRRRGRAAARPASWSSTRRSATTPAGGAPSSTCWRPATGATSRSASPAVPTRSSASTPTSSTGRAPASCSRWARSRRRCSAGPARRRTRRRRSRTPWSCSST